ncbi:putative mechanosensitive channel protein [Cedecea neteri]|uniref:Putative mechanosensitive channel protein n=1 Tax=Cedecea neteri TaxID=158822 RepID=A0A2X2SWL6_9ENTR|nr:putative mechanosensitive channel protein [Cedecea neteri]
MRWILILLFSLMSLPGHAVTLPAAAVAASTSQSNTATPAEPSVEEKKKAYSALADVLDNPKSRSELIEQLRKVAADDASQAVPAITPPDTLTEDKTVLENVTGRQPPLRGRTHAAL